MESMNLIKINLNTENSFILTGAITELNKNRRAKFFLEENYQHLYTDNGLIVSFNKEDKEQTLSELSSALEKYGFKTINSDSIKELLSDYFKAEENFQEFSQKAKGIWN